MNSPGHNAPNNDPRSKAWSSYWSQGPLHSCIGSFDANYSGAIGTFWDAFAADITPGARILDLATGNGALPMRLWQRHGAAARLHIDAVDLATLAPAWYQPDTHAGIHFHSGVAMEALPFADASFDRVVSQFGIEYAQRPASLDESLRVLKPDGHMALVMHHADSVLVTVGRGELANLEHLLASGGLIDSAQKVIPWIAQARNGVDIASNAEALRTRQDYNAAMSALATALDDNSVPDALLEARQWIHGLLSGAHGTQAATQLQVLQAYRDNLQSARLRTAELVEHALDPRQLQSIVQHLRNARPTATCRTHPLRQPEGLLAWSLTLSPA